MRKRDLVDGVVGPRTREMMDQMLCMKGMTNAEKVDFLMSRNRELRAENDKLRVELTDLRLKTCPSCGIKVENEKLRELVRDMWDFFCVVPDDPHVFKEELDFSVEVWKRMAELGMEVES